MIPALLAIMSRIRGLRHRASHLAPFAIQHVLGRDRSADPGLSNLAHRLMVCPLPDWSDWDSAELAGGYIVQRPAMGELRQAILRGRRGRVAGASVTAVTGPSASGKSVVVLGVGREFAGKRPRGMRVYRLDFVQVREQRNELRDRMADLCALARWEYPCAGVIAILEDMHQDWDLARHFVSELESDPRLRSMHVVLTARELPERFGDSQVRAWYDALQRIESGGEAEFRQTVSDIARRICVLSPGGGIGRKLDWDRIEPHVDEWLRETRNSLLEWALLLLTLVEVDGQYTVDRPALLRWVLADVGALTTQAYPQLAHLYQLHATHPADAVIAVSCIQESADLPVSQRFVVQRARVPQPLMDALVDLGIIIRLSVSGDAFVKLGHQGRAHLLAEAAQQFPLEAANAGFALAQGVDARNRRPEEFVWGQYLGWMATERDVPAFASLCERIYLGTQRRGVPTNSLPGVLLTVRLEVLMGADPAFSVASDLPREGMIQPLNEVTFLTAQQIRRGHGQDLARIFRQLAQAGVLDELCAHTLADVHSNAAAGAMLLLLGFGVKRAPGEAARLLVQSSNPQVRMTCAYVAGATQYYPAAPQLRDTLARDSSRSVRAVSAWALGRLSIEHENVDALVGAFGDGDDWVATEAIWAASHLADFRIAAPLVLKWATCGEDTDQGFAAWYSLNQLTASHSEADCRAALNAGDPTVRFGALWCLADKGDEDARSGLSILMGDADVIIRSAAFGVFAQTDWGNHPDDFMHGLDDGQHMVEALAAKAAGQWKVVEAIPRLQQLLHSPNPLVIYNSIMALVRLPAYSSVRLLEGLVGDERRVSRRHTVGEAATEAVERISRRLRATPPSQQRTSHQ